jgi:MFS family permease
MPNTIGIAPRSRWPSASSCCPRPGWYRFEGWFVDRFGPKLVVFIGGILVGVAWIINAVAASLFVLYVAAAIGGIGAGAV